MSRALIEDVQNLSRAYQDAQLDTVPSEVEEPTAGFAAARAANLPVRKLRPRISLTVVLGPAGVGRAVDPAPVPPSIRRPVKVVDEKVPTAAMQLLKHATVAVPSTDLVQLKGFDPITTANAVHTSFKSNRLRSQTEGSVSAGQGIRSHPGTRYRRGAVSMCWSIPPDGSMRVLDGNAPSSISRTRRFGSSRPT